MVMNFRQHRMEKEKRRKIYGAIFLFTLVFLLGRKPVLDMGARVLHLIGIPFWHMAESVQSDASYMMQYVRPRKVLVSDILSLEKKLQDLSSASLEIDALRAENLRLKEELGRKESEQKVIARVLSRPPAQIYDTLIVDVGEKDGVSLGDIVFAHGEYVVGTVTRVYTHTAVVTLLSAPGESRTVSVAGSDSESPEVFELHFTGIGGGGFKTQVPKHMMLKPGAPLALPLSKTAFLGVLSTETIPESGSLKEVFATLPFSINALDWVSIHSMKQ